MNTIIQLPHNARHSFTAAGGGGHFTSGMVALFEWWDKMGHIGTPKKDVALALALAAGESTLAAAAQAGVGKTTAYRRLANPAFRRLVAELRADLVAEAVGRLAKQMTRAADALGVLLDSADERVRLRGARAVLSLGHQLREATDVDDRLRELEQELARKQGGLP